MIGIAKTGRPKAPANLVASRQTPAEDVQPRSSAVIRALFIPLLGLGAVVCALVAAGLLITRYPAQAGSLWAIQVVLGIAGLLLIGVVILLIRRHLVAPLVDLRRWALAMQSGDLSARVPELMHGAFAELARDINDVGEALQICSNKMEAEVHRQTERLAQKTRSLEILYDVATIINVSRDINDLLERFLHKLKAIVNACAASVRLRTDGGQMRLVASVGLENEVMEQEQLLPLDQCLCGDAILEGDIREQSSMRQCEKIVGRRFFDNDNVRMIAVPLQYGGHTVGVYNLFVEDEGIVAREDMKEFLTSIGRHLGTALEKARLDEEANRLSIMEERTRLAHELHDSLAQTLASLRFQVRVLDQTVHQGNESALWQALEQVENSLDEAYRELRNLIAYFRGSGSPRGLVPAVEELVNRFRKESGINIFLQKEWSDVQLSAEREIQVLRIVQESLNNIRKHSHAQNVRVMLSDGSNGDLRMLVEDDGVGFDKPVMEGSAGEHIGLSIMEERARRLGGKLRVESETGEGTRVLLSFPKRDQEKGGEEGLQRTSG